MKLVIVESPTKSKTIGHYLGSDYVVEASVGHIRDLAIRGKDGLGIDVDDNFKPTYVVDTDKKAVVSKLLKLSKEADETILATDADREGEAIAWHLMSVLNLPIESTKRLEFYEITRNSILEAMKNPRTLDMNIVHSQETRRIIDRILGFKLSKLLQSKIKSKSAGRVQSVVLKLICDHEKEIKEFVPEEYWNVDFSINKNDKEFPLTLTKYKNAKITIKNEAQANDVVAGLGDTMKVTSIQTTRKSTPSKEPYRTSTLEQDANTVYKFGTKVTAYLAQQLYEGVELKDEGLVGLITYMRTDSTRISESFVNSAKDMIIKKYGKEYYRGQKQAKDVKMQQDAHECIRPTSVDRTPESIRYALDEKAYKLYKLIYDRTIASLMTNKEEDVTTVTFNSKDCEANLKGYQTVFEGFGIIKKDESDKTLPGFAINEDYKIINVKKEQKFTEPPARYTEGRLVKLMEEDGIGRPSTYSSTIQTLITRKYISSVKGSLTPSEQGILTANVLNKFFPDLMSTTYTANMESDLDKIQDGDIDELKVIKDFYYPFIEHLEEVKKDMYKEPLKKTGEKCPNCGGDLVIRHGRFGEFVSCSNYPTCKYIQKTEKAAPKEVGRACPDCGKPLVYRFNKKGQQFVGCSNYPTCKYIEVKEDETIKNAPKKVCPECGADMVLRSSRRGYFYGCTNFPKCKHIEAYEEKKENEEK